MSTDIQKLRDEVAQLREATTPLHRAMSDAESAYWVADAAWRKRAWDLFELENPDLAMMAAEAKGHRDACAELSRKVRELAKERNATPPAGYFDQ